MQGRTHPKVCQRMGPVLLVCHTSRVEYRGQNLLLGKCLRRSSRHNTFTILPVPSRKVNYRNSLSDAALVKTLGLQELEGTWKLSKHDGVIKSQCEEANSFPPPAVDTPSVDHVQKDGTDEKQYWFETTLMFLFSILPRGLGV